MAQDSDKEFEEKMNRMIFDYLNERKMDKIAKKFSKECGTDMDKKFKRPNLKKEWLNFLKQAEERYALLTINLCTPFKHDIHCASLCGVEFVVTKERREKRAQRESCLKGERSLHYF